MRARAWMLGLGVATGGCSFGAPGSASDGGNGDGTPIDAPVDAFASGYCVGTFVRVCTPDPPPPTLSIGNQVIDTGTYSGCLVRPQSSGPDLCVLYAGTVTITGTLRAAGSRVLVLAATTTIMVNGQLDVSSKRGMYDGAGANDPACKAPGASAGDGGGAGGSFTGSGGAGGDANGTGRGSPGGTIATFTRVMGGCRGGGSGSGTGGAGGGATMLIAGTRIDVNGIIVASGSGGIGGGGGGDGGGSGGFIGFDAPAVRVGNRVVANGGGGGGAAGLGGGGGNGGDGRDDTNVAQGGPAGFGLGGANGGDGAADGVLMGEGGGSNSNGGGGGGGAGAIVVFGQPPESGGTYSPPFRVQP